MDWSEGYVADLGYVRGCYRELGASMQAFILAANGYEAPDLNAPFTKVELGCGYGVSLLLEAAVYPHAQFFGVDFNPDHITWAKRIAAQAQLNNVHFLEMSFADLLGSPIPDADFVGLHGVWSWVSDENRQAISRFLDRRLKSGGLAMVSYNVLPGQSANRTLRELMMRKYRSIAGPTASRVKESLAFAAEFRDLSAPIFTKNVDLSDQLNKITVMPPRYLAHEYFNQDWHLFYHHEVAEALAKVRLSYIGTARPIENLEKLSFQAPFLKLLEKVAPQERETLKDLYLNRMFRFDIYGRGLEKIGPIGSVDHILKSRFALVGDRSKFAEGVLNTTAGAFKYKKELHQPIFDRLETSTACGQDFVFQPGPRPLTPADVTEMLSILIDVGIISTALPDDGLELRTERTKRLNQVLLERMQKGEDIGFLISPVSGVPYSAVDFVQYFMSALNLDKEPILFAWSLLKALGKRMMKDGKPIDGREQNIKELELRFQEFERDHKPRLKRLGIVA